MIHKKFYIKAFGNYPHLDEVTKITEKDLELLFSGNMITISKDRIGIKN
jgi:hypothetical protein